MFETLNLGVRKTILSQRLPNESDECDVIFAHGASAANTASFSGGLSYSRPRRGETSCPG